MFSYNFAQFPHLEEHLIYRSQLLTENQRLFACLLMSTNKRLTQPIYEWVVSCLGFSRQPIPNTPVLESVCAIGAANFNASDEDLSSELAVHFALLKASSQIEDFFEAVVLLRELAEVLDCAVTQETSQGF